MLPACSARCHSVAAVYSVHVLEREKRRQQGWPAVSLLFVCVPANLNIKETMTTGQKSESNRRGWCLMDRVGFFRGIVLYDNNASTHTVLKEITETAKIAQFVA